MASLLLFFSSLLIYNHESPQYLVQQKIQHFEIRKYEPWVVAETVVKGDFENAGDQAFHILAGYIFGANDQKVKIQMTAPVTQKQVGENEFLVQFFMPKQWTLQTLPRPNDPRVNLKQLPERQVVSLRYIGGWSEAEYNEKLSELRKELSRESVKPKGEPIWARYNSPMAPWFVRTNEIQFEI